MANVIPIKNSTKKRPVLSAVTKDMGEKNNNEHWIQCLVKVARDQDRHSFQLLFDNFAPKIKSFYLKHKLSLEESEELTQETFISVWKFADYFEANKGQVSTWVYTIARNKKLDYFRKTNREVKTSELVSEDIATEPGNQFMSQAGDEVRSLLQQLPEEQIQVIQKVYFEELSHQKAADVLNITLGTVKGRIRSAINNLNKLMRGGK